MKTKINSLSVFLLLTGMLWSPLFVNTAQGQQSSETINNEKSHYVFIGAGIGVNDYGLGIIVEVPVIQGCSVYGHIGLGGWGSKYGGGISYYPKKVPYKSCFSIAYSLATGMEDFETELATEPNSESQNVLLDLNNVGTINLIYTYDIKLGRFSKLGLSAGYAIPLTKNAYDVKTPGITLNDSSDLVMKILQPGGLIIGLRLMFGI